MSTERRRSPRVKVNLRARWEAALMARDAAVTSLSMNGCFVLSGGRVEVRELVRLEINLSDQTQIVPWAVVVEQATEIGFAVKFSSMNDQERELLTQFMDAALASA